MSNSVAVRIDVVHGFWCTWL